jgi:HEAT repeat protein
VRLTIEGEPARLVVEMSADHRQMAQRRVEQLIATLGSEADRDRLQPLVSECEALARAIAAFHIEGIRFRMFNVDRLLSRGGLPVPPEAAGTFAEVRRDLEAAGFHTRSH